MTYELKLRGVSGAQPGSLLVLSDGVWGTAGLGAASTAYGVVRSAETSLVRVVLAGGMRIPGWGLTPGGVYFPNPLSPSEFLLGPAESGHAVPVFVALTEEDAFVFGPTHHREYRLTFSDADLFGGELTAMHGLGDAAVQVGVCNDAGLQIVAPITSGEESVTVDLSAYSPLAGTWKLVVRR